MSDLSTLEEQYRRVLSTVAKDGSIAFSGGTSAEARTFKKTLVQIQKELRLLKKAASLQKRVISSSFTTRRTMVGKGVGSGFIAGLLGRKRAGALNAIRKEGLRSEQVTTVAPLDQFAQKIDRVVAQLDVLKNEIDRAILEGRLK